MKFKTYQKKDFKSLVNCMEELQDHLIQVDNLKRLRRLKAYGKFYTQNLIKKIQKQKGIIILAYKEINEKANRAQKEKEEKQKKDTEKIILGCVAVVVEKQSKTDLLECVPTRPGRILELLVAKNARNQGVGKALMKKAESYLKQKKCDVIRVEVFKPNTQAHEFYKKLSYQDRTIDMLKQIK